MQTVQVSSDWYPATCKSLAVIEENAADYEDPEEGDKAPTKEIFAAVRGFLDALQKKTQAKLEEPRLFVSPSGHLVLTYGDKNRGIDIRFSPAVWYSFKQGEQTPVKGEKLSEAVDLVAKHFSG